MRKYFIAILLFAILPGCEKDFDEIIDVTPDNYQVKRIDGIKDTIDLKNPPDSLLNLRVIFNSESEVSKVYFEIQASDDNIIVSSEMIPAGVDTFENVFIFRNNYPIGNYKIRFSASGFNGVRKQVAVANFYFNNGQDNVAPEISNLIMPDTIQAGETIIFSVKANDSNGLNDINFVFYEAYNPDGVRVVNSQGIFQFPLFDNGENGDVTAGDGIFTVALTFPTTAQLGTWRFEFQAKDRSGLLSDKIIHNIVIR